MQPSMPLSSGREGPVDKIEDIAGTGAGLLKNLNDALAAYNEAHETAQRASSAENSAINRLNECQKALDAFHKALHEQAAPWNSDWHARRDERAAP